MTQRTSDMHPFVTCPYSPRITGSEAGCNHTNAPYQYLISIVDERTGAQVEGVECHSRKDLRRLLGTRMAYWRTVAERETHEEPTFA